MKHAQIAIINPAVSPVMTGTLLPKPALRNAAVLINILARAQVKVLLGIPVAENIRLVIAKAAIAGTEVSAKFIVAAHTNIFAMVLMKP